MTIKNFAINDGDKMKISSGLSCFPCLHPWIISWFFEVVTTKMLAGHNRIHHSWPHFWAS